MITRRTRRLARLGIGLVFLLWAVCFVLSVRAAVWPRGFSSVVVEAPAQPGGHPTLRSFWSFLPGERSELRPGDRLLRLGDADLTDVGPVRFFVITSEQAGTRLELPVVYERAGQRLETMLPLGSTGITAPLLPAALLFAASAAFLLLRARPSPLARGFAAAFLCNAFFFSGSFFGSPAETWASIAIHAVTMTLSGPLQLRAFLRFPRDVAPRGRLARFGPWAFALVGPLHMSRFGFPPAPEIAIPGAVGGVVLYLAVLLALMLRAHRRADPVERRQIKWFLYGVYLALAAALAGALLAAWDTRFTGVYVVSLGALAFVPLSLLISVHRYDIFDVDRLISTTASFNVLLVGLVALGVGAVPWLADQAAQRLGVEAWAGHALIAVGLASAVIPVHRALRPAIERVFFPERWALDRGIDRLLDEVSGCADPKGLIEHVARSLWELLRPESCVAYARSSESFVPAFCEGRVVPSALHADDSRIAGVRRWREPLALGEVTSRAADLDRFDRAAFETLGAALVLPIRHGEELLVLLCLGRKRSGDIYTSTDVHLLAALAAQVSTELSRFDHDRVVQEARSMQEALRRYVPRVIAEQLAQGAELEPAEREVSVLFVDLRGYTSYCEERSPREIFAAVNRYTETVSRVASEHGGNVVDFSGDGVMVVFGAPHDLPDKERAAVRAAREILAAVDALEAGREPGARLVAGAGVATGPAVIGSIRSADRLVWSALGNTTNLAARLEALSRELDAAVVIDATTQCAAGDAAAGFELRSCVVIRGRSGTRDVFVLPRPASAELRHPPGRGETPAAAPTRTALA